MKDPRTEAVARSLNVNGWSCGLGTHEPGQYDTCTICKHDCNALARDAIEAADQASIITTFAELDALPIGSVILDGDPAVLQMVEKSSLVGSEWAMANEEHIYTTGKITLPARVIQWGDNA